MHHSVVQQLFYRAQLEQLAEFAPSYHIITVHCSHAKETVIVTYGPDAMKEPSTQK